MIHRHAGIDICRILNIVYMVSHPQTSQVKITCAYGHALQLECTFFLLRSLPRTAPNIDNDVSKMS
jgi:hypothetical protein